MPSIYRVEKNTDCFSTMELNVGIICACLPCLKPILKRHFPSLMSNTTNGDVERTALSHNHYMDNINPKSDPNYKMSTSDTDTIHNVPCLSFASESEKAAQEIRDKIKVWNIKGKHSCSVDVIPMEGEGSGNRGSADGQGEDREGVFKSVCYGVSYEVA